MSFLDGFDQADEDDIPDEDYLYLDRTCPGDYDFRVKEVDILKHSEGRPDEGEPFFVASLEVVNKRKGQPTASEGDTLSYKVEMTDNASKTKKEYRLKDIARILGAMAGRGMAHFLEKGKIKERIRGACGQGDAADEYDDLEGTMIRGMGLDGKESDKTDKTWYNYTWTHLEGDDDE